MKVPSIVEVHWLDAHTVDEWHEELDSEPRACLTSGYLVKETKNSVVIAVGIDIKSPVTYCSVITIPKVCITGKMVILRQGGGE